MASLARPQEEAKPQTLKNPAVGVIKWDSDGGFFRFNIKREDGSYDKEPIKNQRFLIVAGGCFRVGGGSMGRDAFTGVSSGIVPTDKGRGWKNIVSVWIGEEKKPALTGTWNEVKRTVEAANGFYCEVLFVVPQDRPFELWQLEMKGLVVSEYIVKKKAFPNIFKEPHTIELEDVYEHRSGTGRNEKIYIMPRLAIARASTLKSEMIESLISMAKRVDAFTDSIIAFQEARFPKSEPERAPTPMPAEADEMPARKAPPPSPMPSRFDEPSDEFDDLPF